MQQGLTAMLYFVAADEYDISSEEDENLSKLDVTLSSSKLPLDAALFSFFGLLTTWQMSLRNASTEKQYVTS